MVRKYFLQQLGLLIMVSVIMVLTNILGYKMPVGDSIAGILVLCGVLAPSFSTKEAMVNNSLTVKFLDLIVL